MATNAELTKKLRAARKELRLLRASALQHPREIALARNKVLVEALGIVARHLKGEKLIAMTREHHLLPEPITETIGKALRAWGKQEGLL